MRNILKRTLGRGAEDQKGFTLIELLVVVGIIVALAAVIVPLVIQFSGRG
ncbi:MAG: prepilin-type N-terminal cleavage/methylation domain-containing protein, partial [Chloroflexi bacterium]|nr:prepilin-type N-terminal cleavage/methylation domain-containing protein [Chloroflexota bacterium]MCI0828519.1 prepilin-type N-terminal cleavage/methylation domain-containing protein [Chloroflexota bacterium]MCI0862784.1 prepilin-type N-terminal cleavage/methylation domain-containing protein [Chloroflexota bacterium]MCI0896710.1 prepilin-type N-terminal cleavage/methylation domain-containing protein [Chloroflexota bacterium]MCI0903054.1 prepilin-type N-terminal cleavage/methylation domain-con